MVLKINFKLHYWPILTSSWHLCTFFITYIISTSDGHVYPFFPYISDTGTRPPESCIFGQLLNIGAVYLAVTMYIRYRQVDITTRKRSINNAWNKYSLVFGYLSCLGISIVANFQETNVLSIHMLGASMAFGIGSIYFIIQVKISLDICRYKETSNKLSKNVAYIRLILGVLSVMLFITTVIASHISGQQFKGTNIEYWTEDDGGFELRLVGTFTEWATAVIMMIFILTYTEEFKSLNFKQICFESTQCDVP